MKGATWRKLHFYLVFDTGGCLVCYSAVSAVYLGVSCQSKYGPALKHNKSRRTLLYEGGVHFLIKHFFLRWLFLSTTATKPESHIMERPSSGLREMVRRHRPKREDLDPRKWMKRENMKGFTDFITNQHSDRDTDNSFDNKEMCEYWWENKSWQTIFVKHRLWRAVCVWTQVTTKQPVGRCDE